MFGFESEGPLIERLERYAQRKAFGGAVIPPGLLENLGQAGAPGENAHRAVDAMLGKATATTAGEKLEAVAALLMADVEANQDLIFEFGDLRKRIAERLEAQRKARFDVLRSEHGEVYRQCRQKLDEVNDLNKQLAWLNSVTQGAAERRGKFHAAFKSAESRRPPRETYPNEQELAAWQKEAGQARQRWEAEEAQYQATVGDARRMAERAGKAAKELEELQQREENLRAELEGRPYSDAYGFVRYPE